MRCSVVEFLTLYIFAVFILFSFFNFDFSSDNWRGNTTAEIEEQNKTILKSCTCSHLPHVPRPRNYCWERLNHSLYVGVQMWTPLDPTKIKPSSNPVRTLISCWERRNNWLCVGVQVQGRTDHRKSVQIRLWPVWSQTDLHLLATVCYFVSFWYADAFIVNDSLPLWPLWQDYFSQCAVGSYTVVIHQQKHNSTHTGTQANISKHIHSVGGRYGSSPFARKLLQLIWICIN